MVRGDYESPLKIVTQIMYKLQLKSHPKRLGNKLLNDITGTKTLNLRELLQGFYLGNLLTKSTLLITSKYV